MRHSKRTHCPDWDSRESWGHESYSGSHKRKRRSHSSTQENRHCKPHHQFKDSDCAPCASPLKLRTLLKRTLIPVTI
nr:lammer protein kinase clk4 truncated isoform [Mus musculus]